MQIVFLLNGSLHLLLRRAINLCLIPVRCTLVVVMIKHKLIKYFYTFVLLDSRNWSVHISLHNLQVSRDILMMSLRENFSRFGGKSLWAGPVPDEFRVVTESSIRPSLWRTQEKSLRDLWC